MRLKHKLGIAVIAIMLALFASAAFAMPDGANVTKISSSTREFTSSGTIGALGGYATSLNVTDVKTQTRVWQGLYGDVSGDISLENALGRVMYSWPNVTSGYVYASTDSAVNFGTIAGQTDCTIDENMTGLGSDRVNRTFTLNALTDWIVASTPIANACQAYSYVNSTPQNSSFEEIILTDDGGITSIYATKIEKNAPGFDGQPHDFQIIIPDDQSRQTTTYYMYAELTG